MTGSVGAGEYAQLVHRLSEAYREIDRLRDRVETVERFLEDALTAKRDLRQFGLDAPKCGTPHPTHEDVSCFRPSGHDKHHLNGSVRW